MKRHLALLVPLVLTCVCTHSSAQQEVTRSTLVEIVDLHRKVIVLLDHAQGGAEGSFVQTARALYYRKQALLEELAGALGSDLRGAESQRQPAGVQRFIDYFNDRDLLPADRLAFTDLIEELASISTETRSNRGAGEPAVSSPLLDLEEQLSSIREDYDEEIVRGGEERGAPGRKAWRSYVDRLERLWSAEDLLETYRHLLPQDEPSLRGWKSLEGRVFGYGLPKKHVVLSFDDGPHHRYTEQIVQILGRYRATGYFFTLGNKVGRILDDGVVELGRGAQVSKKVFESGHRLGNHSFSHPSLTKVPKEERERQIADTNRLLAKITGDDPALFRPPYGATNDAIFDLVRLEKMTEVLWNVDSWDWGDPVPRSIVDRVLVELERSNRGILLFHDIHKQTLVALPMILEELVRRGYRLSDMEGNAADTPAIAASSKGRSGDEASASAKKGNYRESWAVVIGINEYLNWPRLSYAVSDAEAVQELLAERLGFRPSHIVKLLDSEATRDAIVEVLGGFLADPGRVDREDRVFVFFAGHGATRRLPSGRSLGYIVPVDAELDGYQTRAISMTHLRDFSELIPAKHIYYIMDSCYSGIALTRGGGSDSYAQEMTRRRARQILTAGGADQAVADTGPGGHSIFTWTLLQGLQGLADMDGNGLLTASELGAYTAPIVSQFSRQTPAFGNLPGSEGGEFLFEMDYESLSEVSQQLDEQAANLNSELERLRQETREKMMRNLDLSREIEAKKRSTASPKEDRIAQANRHHALGLQLFREKRYDLALRELEQALAFNRDNPTIVNNYGFLLYRMDRHEDAIEWFERTVALDPNRTVVYVNLADAYMKLGDEDQATTYYREYLALWPSSPRASEIRALLDAMDP